MKTDFRTVLVLLVAVGSGTAVTYGAPGDVDPTFHADLGPAKRMDHFAVQPDGKIVIGNDTPAVGLLRLNEDGSRDASFAPDWVLPKRLFKVASTSNSRILIYCSFATDFSTNALVRLNSDGRADSSFMPRLSPDQTLLDIAPAPEEKVIVYVTKLEGDAASSGLMRLNPDGSADPTFTPARIGDSGANDILVQDDGRILLWGQFLDINGKSRFGLARLRADGTLDLGFLPAEARLGAAQNPLISSACPLPDGRVLIAGEFDAVGGRPAYNVALLNSDGSLDSTFSTGSTFASLPFGADFVAAQQDGKVLVAASTVFRINSNGTVDTGYLLTTGLSLGSKPILLPDDKLLLPAPDSLYRILGGDFPAGLPSIVLPPLSQTTTEAQSATFSVQVRSVPPPVYQWQFEGRDLAHATNASLVVTNLQFSDSGSYAVEVSNSFGDVISAPAQLRVNALPTLAGAVDLSFDPAESIENSATVRALALQGKKVLIGGDFYTYRNRPAPHLARLESDGTFDDTFKGVVGTDDVVSSLAVDANGLIYLAGSFTAFGNSARPGLARLNADGGLDLSYVPGLAAGTVIKAITLLSDGKLLAAGSFLGQPLLKRLDHDGSLDSIFAASLGVSDGSCSCLGVLQDGRIVVGGLAIGDCGLCGFLSRLASDGSPDPTMPAPANLGKPVQSVLVFDDGSVLVGLSVAAMAPGSNSRLSLWRLLPNGRFAEEFSWSQSQWNMALAPAGPGQFLVAGLNRVDRFSTDPAASAHFRVDLDNFANAMVVQSDGRILLAGRFGEINGVTRHSIARIFGDNGVRAPVLIAPAITKTGFSASVPTITNAVYTIEFSEAVNGLWQKLDGFSGDGNWKRFSDPSPTLTQRFYRVRAE